MTALHCDIFYSTVVLHLNCLQKSEEGHNTGFLADTVESYTDCLRKIFNLSRNEKISMATVARQACQRFSERVFEEGFLNAVDDIIAGAKKQQ